MRVAHFITLYPLEKGGKYYGSSVSAYNLTKEIAKKDVEEIVFTTSSTSEELIKTERNINVFAYGANINILTTRLSLGLFFKPLKHRSDIVNVNFDIPPGPFAGLLYSKIKGVPLVVTYRGDWPDDYGSIFRRIMVGFFNKVFVGYLLKNAKIIISPTERYISESKFLKKYQEKIVVIPNGIRMEEYELHMNKIECRKELKLPTDAKILLFVGAIAPHKGPDILLKAMPRILQSQVKTILIYVGEGVMREGLEKLAKEMGIQEQVLFPGFITDTKTKAKYYKSSDIFVFPTTGGHEVFGNVALEAMACGTPIVASNIGGIPDVVKDKENGVLVPPRDIECLSNAIIYLLNNPEIMENMGNKGKELSKKYSWAEISNQTIASYNQVKENQLKKKGCLINFPTTIAGNIPLSNLINILCPLTSSLNVITGNAGYELAKADKRITVHGINHKKGSNFLTIIIRYLSIQLKISYKLVKIRDKVDFCIFFVGAEGLMLPIITAKILGKKVVLAPAEYTMHSNKDILSKILSILSIVPRILSDRIIVYSEKIIDKWKLNSYRHKISIAREHIVDYSNFRISTNVNNRDTLVGYIGRFNEEKGVRNFVEAIPKIMARDSRVKFLIAGAGPLQSEIKQCLNDNNLTDKIKLVEWIPRDQLSSYLNTLKLIVIPSYTEGLPNIMLEAMLCGTPVLVTPVGAIPDLIKDGETGFILKNNSPEVIAEGVLQVLAYPQTQKIANNAKTLIEKEYTYDKAVEGYKRALCQLWANTSGRDTQ